MKTERQINLNKDHYRADFPSKF